MSKRSLRGGDDRPGKRKSHARPDRIIEKRANWQDYLDPDEDPGLLDEDDLVEDPDETDEVAETSEIQEEDAKDN